MSTNGISLRLNARGEPMPIERRRKPSAAGMAKRGFLRASEGQDARSERPRDGMGSPRPHTLQTNHIGESTT
ncbi:MAG: hypothetical protein EBV45_04190 [Chloroflexi bacterium]|nr:hypothetical protein [Chloroflexota bacterium]